MELVKKRIQERFEASIRFFEGEAQRFERRTDPGPWLIAAGECAAKAELVRELLAVALEELEPCLSSAVDCGAAQSV